MKHIYHFDCINKWLQTSIKCPICKYDEVEEIYNFDCKKSINNSFEEEDSFNSDSYS